LIKDLFQKGRRSISEVVLEATTELGKYYSRLEFAASKLGRRDQELFNACSYHLKKGSKARATIYANEIVEIRKILTVVRQTQLAVERAILRLETLKTAVTTFESLKGVFVDVKKALGLVANIMPAITPEMDKLNRAISDVLDETQVSLTAPEPLILNDATTEAILKEAADFAEQELQSRIPEPPVDLEIPRPVKSTQPLVALTADGSEVYFGEDSSNIGSDGSPNAFDGPQNLLSEELVMDYIERHNGEMNVKKCAQELNLPPVKVLEALEALNRKGKIKIEK